MNNPLADVAAERAVLSGICQFGQNTYLDIADIVKEKSFTNEYNQAIFACLKHVLNKEDIAEIDVASIYSAGEELGLANLLAKKSCSQHIQSLFNFPVAQKNIRRFAGKITKLQIARDYRTKLSGVCDDLLAINGDESITHILGIGENAIFEFSEHLLDSDNEPQMLGDGLVDYVNYLASNPVDQLGFHTGFPEYDAAIGGGLRPGTVNVIGARPKVGKTLLSSNMGYHLAANEKIPILNMDTEMQLEDHQHRTLAMSSDCYIYDIETGKFAQKPGHRKKVMDASRKIEDEKIPYYHRSISGMPFEEQLAVMRRWLVKKVGFDNEGTANPCVIIYDYLKLMTSESIDKNLAEFQALGFMMTSLHNFSIKYKLPILLFIQLNRDGINREGTDTASGSDRVIWLCSNFTIFKTKSDEEIAADGAHSGNRKLVPVVARHGSGLADGDYINCFMKGNTSSIIEGKRKFEASKQDNENTF